MEKKKNKKKSQDRARGLSRKTREVIGKGNQMTAGVETSDTASLLSWCQEGCEKVRHGMKTEEEKKEKVKAVLGNTVTVD